MKVSKDPEGRMPLGEHIRELRTRLFRASVGIALGAVVGWFIHQWVIQLLENTVCTDTSPRRRHPQRPQCTQRLGDELTGPTAGLRSSLKVSLMVGLLVACPVWLYQLWAFIAPGLHRTRRSTAWASSPPACRCSPPAPPCAT